MLVLPSLSKQKLLAFIAINLALTIYIFIPILINKDLCLFCDKKTH